VSSPMGTDRCDFSDLPPSMCSHCLGLDARERAEKRTETRSGTGIGRSFPARFAGKCGCGEPITVGELIRYDEEGGWLRLACCGGDLDD
jgi:hypothetical protein